MIKKGENVKEEKYENEFVVDFFKMKVLRSRS